MLKKIIISAGLAAMVTSPVYAQSCAVTPVHASAKVRELQSVLMVGALQCRHLAGSTVIADYNRFISAHKAALQNHNGALRAHFVRASGKTGMNDFDSFTTRLANAHAQSASSAGFCAMVGQLVQTAAEVASEHLPHFAVQMMPESAACLKHH
jgi:hypothetical protein